MDEQVNTMGPLAVQAMGLLIDTLGATPREVWQQPSNLDGWTVRDLIGHVTGSAAKVVALVEGGELWGRSEPADWTTEDPEGRLRGYLARLQDALPAADMTAARNSPEGEVPLQRALMFPVADMAMHSWDLQRSQGGLIDLPDDLLEFCRTLVSSVPDEVMRRPGGFGPALPAPDDASPTAKLMAYLGRS